MRPAIEVWREAFSLPHQAAAAVIEADRLAVVAEIVAELKDITTRFGLAGQVDTETVAWAADHIEAKFGGNNGDR